MFNALSNTLQSSLQAVVEVISPFALSSLPNFPYIRYMAQLDAYRELESWYLGTVLNVEVVDKANGKKFDRYPLKLNPIRGTCSVHATTLIGRPTGMLADGGMPVKILCDSTKVDPERAKKVQDALASVWQENGGAAIFAANALMSQYYGGSIFAAAWIPEENRIRITNPNPKEFVGIPDGQDYWHLREAWVVKELNRIDLIQYGFDPDLKDNRWHYIEHWTKDKYSVSINSTPLQVGGTLTEGDNPFKEVPYVYIPHIRIWSFYGDPIISDAVRGIVREINLRWADIGDAVSDDSHAYIYIRNVRNGVKTITLGDNRPIFDLGSTTGISGNEANPEMQAVKAESASEPMIKYGKELWELYRKEVYHPAVADGEDTGSQRSAATIATRMVPLTDHIEMERAFWTVGLIRFSHILLAMMAEKHLYDIDENDIKVTLRVQWQPMVTKDREQLVNEVIQRAAVGLGSPQTLLEILGDIPDIQEEMNRIAEAQEAAAALQHKYDNTEGGSKGGSDKGKKGSKSGSGTPNKSRPGEQTTASGAPDQMQPAHTGKEGVVGMGGGSYGLSQQPDAGGPGQVGL